MIVIAHAGDMGGATLGSKYDERSQIRAVNECTDTGKGGPVGRPALCEMSLGYLFFV